MNMNWITAVVAVFSFAKELLKYIASKEESKKQAINDMKCMTKALKKARRDGDMSDVEAKFGSLGLFGGKHSVDELSDPATPASADPAVEAKVI